MLLDGFMVSGNVGVSTTGCAPLKELDETTGAGAGGWATSGLAFSSTRGFSDSKSVDGLTSPGATGALLAASDVGATGT